MTVVCRPKSDLPVRPHVLLPDMHGDSHSDFIPPLSSGVQVLIHTQHPTSLTQHPTYLWSTLHGHFQGRADHKLRVFPFLEACPANNMDYAFGKDAIDFGDLHATQHMSNSRTYQASSFRSCLLHIQ